MRTTTSGRAFAKGIFDLFSTLMVSLPIENHKILFKNYPNSFTAEEAIANLGGLQFIQSNRDADPMDPTRIITHVVTTQFSLSRDMAKNLCQTFMDARLFESASDPNKREFQNKGIYQVTGKGAHILAKFVHRNALPVDETRHITANATAHLVYLDRADDEDAIILSQKQMEIIFKRFAGPEPNVAKIGSPGSESPLSASSPGGRDRSHSVPDLCNGIEVKDQQHNYDIYKHTFYGKAAVEWLMDYSTVISKEEAICIAQEMVTGGYIEQVGEENTSGRSLFKTGNSALYHLTELGRAQAGWKSLVSSSGSSINNDWMEERGTSAGSKSQHNNADIKNLSAQFRLTASTSPRLPISIAREKRVVLGAEETGNATNSNNPYGEDLSSSNGKGSTRRLSQILNDPAFQLAALSESGPGSVVGGMGGGMSNYASSSSGGRESTGGSGPTSSSSVMNSSSQSMTSNTTRLNIILANATLRDLFKSFLRQNICEENLSFYLEVLDYRAKFVTLINSSRSYTQQDPSLPQQQQVHPPALRELENQICMQAFSIYETYLASGASKEVNLPHQMRQDITAYMQAVVRNMDSNQPAPPNQTSAGTGSAPGSPSSTSAEMSDSERSMNGSGHQKELIHIALFDGIHDHIFRLMSTDSVPKFTRTDKYREVMMNRVKQNNMGSNNSGSGASTPTATSPGASRGGGSSGEGAMMGGMVEASGTTPVSPGTPGGRIEDEGGVSLRRSMSLNDRNHPALYQRAATNSTHSGLFSAQQHQHSAQQPVRVPRVRSASSNVPVNEIRVREESFLQQHQRQQQQQLARQTYNFEQPVPLMTTEFKDLNITPSAAATAGAAGVAGAAGGAETAATATTATTAAPVNNVAQLMGVIVPRQQQYHNQRAQLPAKLQKKVQLQSQPIMFPARGESSMLSPTLLSPRSPKSSSTFAPMPSSTSFSSLSSSSKHKKRSSISSLTKSLRSSNSVPFLNNGSKNNNGNQNEDEEVQTDDDDDDDLLPLHELLASSPPSVQQRSVTKGGASAVVPARVSSAVTGQPKALPMVPLSTPTSPPRTVSAAGTQQQQQQQQHVTVLFESTSVAILDPKLGSKGSSHSISSLETSPTKAAMADPLPLSGR